MSDRRLALAGVAWLTIVVAVAVARALSGWPEPGSLAASPDALEHGRLWLLATSSLVIEGPAVAQIAGVAFLGWVLVRRFGAGMLWATAIAGHVVATMSVYAGVALVGLMDAHAVRSVTDAADYGISAVWAACAGAVCVAGLMGELPRPRLAVALGVALLLAFAVLVPANGELSDVEHLVAFVTGAALAVRALHHGARAHGDPLRPARLPSLRRRSRAAADAAR
jgi:hypothetical protein